MHAPQSTTGIIVSGGDILTSHYFDAVEESRTVRLEIMPETLALLNVLQLKELLEQTPKEETLIKDLIQNHLLTRNQATKN